MDICTFNDYYLNLLLNNLSKETNKAIVLLGYFNIDLLNFDTSEHVSTFLNNLSSDSLQPPDSSIYQNTFHNSKTVIYIFLQYTKPTGQKPNVWEHLIK